VKIKQALMDKGIDHQTFKYLIFEIFKDNFKHGQIKYQEDIIGFIKVNGFISPELALDQTIRRTRLFNG
jgi:hypothetical protein